MGPFGWLTSAWHWGRTLGERLTTEPRNSCWCFWAHMRTVCGVLGYVWGGSEAPGSWTCVQLDPDPVICYLKLISEEPFPSQSSCERLSVSSASPCRDIPELCVGPPLHRCPLVLAFQNIRQAWPLGPSSVSEEKNPLQNSLKIDKDETTPSSLEFSLSLEQFLPHFPCTHEFGLKINTHRYPNMLVGGAGCHFRSGWFYFLR